MLEKYLNWYNKVAPKKWKGKGGKIGFLMFMWVLVIIFEIFWITTGNDDPYAIIGMPVFFGVITFIIGKWSLEIW